MKNKKVLLILVARNNHVLLQHFVETLEKFDSGYPYELLIADNSSDDYQQLDLYSKLNNKYVVKTFPNNRVEATFEKAYLKYKGLYSYYMFLHDDTAITKDGWLKEFVDRMNSGHVELQIKDTEFAKLPIGRVGAIHQPWRNYTSMAGQPIQCRFLEEFLHVFCGPNKTPSMFKFVDPERVLYSAECLEKISTTNPIWSVQVFKDWSVGDKKELYDQTCRILSKFLPYADEGIAPKDQYPPAGSWNKITMLSEFLNSVQPLLDGYRSVGLVTDGFTEHTHGFCEPWGHQNGIIHYGSPNIKRFFARYFKTSGEEIHKKIYSKDKAFLIKCDKILKDYIK